MQEDIHEDSFTNLQQDAMDLARSMNHREVTLTHLAVALFRCKNYNIGNTLSQNKIDPFKAESGLLNELSADVSLRQPVDAKNIKSFDTSRYSPEIGNLYTYAQKFSYHTRKSNIVTGMDLLVTLANKKEIKNTDKLIDILLRAGLDYDICVELAKNEDNIQQTTPEYEKRENKKSEQKKRELVPAGFKGYDPYIAETDRKSILSQFAVNLVLKARTGGLRPVYGRNKQIERIATILGMKESSNPLLVGESGEGKTATMEGLAYQIANGTAPASLLQKNIFSVDLGAMVAGTKYRGEFEERIVALIEEAKREDVILYFDEARSIIGAGDAEGAMDAASLLLTAMGRGEIHVAGAITPDDKRKFIDDNPAFRRRFNDVLFDDLPFETSKNVLLQVKASLETDYKISITDKILDEVITLCDRHRNRLPLIAACKKIVHETGAKLNIHRAKDDDTIRNLSVADFEPQIAAIFNAPLHSVSLDEGKVLVGLEDKLKKDVVGQEKAARELANATFRFRAGIKNRKKPVGSFLFLGPTGVGKTEMVLSYGEHIGLPVVRINMSDYMDKHSLSKLIGTTAGWTGYDDGGELTNAVSKKPRCIVLFDEIEKAHPDMQTILLQILDDGMITDSKGREVSFRQSVIVMTSNLGAHEYQQGGSGFDTSDDTPSIRTDLPEAVREYFRPEVLNRIDNIVQFSHLEHEHIVYIFDKFMDRRKKDLQEKHIKINVSAAAKDLVSQWGYSSAYGARFLDRMMTEKIDTPLSREIILGKLKKGGAASIGVTEDEKSLTFKFKAANDNAGRKKGKAAAQPAPVPA